MIFPVKQIPGSSYPTEYGAIVLKRRKGAEPVQSVGVGLLRRQGVTLSTAGDTRAAIPSE